LYTIDKRVIHDLYTTLLKRGSKSGGPLSPTTVRTVHRVPMKDLGITVAGVRQPRQAERETMGRKGVWTPVQSAEFLPYHADHRHAGPRSPPVTTIGHGRLHRRRAGCPHLRWIE
jgi:hypothetical protein